MFLSLILKCISGILQVLKYAFISDSSGTGQFDPKILRKYTVDIVCQEKMNRLVSGKMQQPYGYILSVLCNMLIMAHYIRAKFPHMIEEKQCKFDENCRDIKILLRNFDTFMAQRLQERISQGIDVNDSSALGKELDYVFRNMLHQGWLEWFQNSQKKIGEHLSLLRYIISKGGGEEAEIIGYLVKQALTSGQVAEIIDMGDDEETD